MRGHLAFTKDWERPIQSEAVQKRARRTTRPRIPSLLDTNVRLVVANLDDLSRKAQGEIRRIFDELGLTAKQRANQLRRIRKR